MYALLYKIWSNVCLASWRHVENEILRPLRDDRYSRDPLFLMRKHSLRQTTPSRILPSCIVRILLLSGAIEMHALARFRLAPLAACVRPARAPALQLCRSVATVAELLARKRISYADMTIEENEPLSTAIARMSADATEALIVVRGGSSVGIITSHDVFRTLAKSRVTGMAAGLDLPTGVAMTPAHKIVHVPPEENVSTAALMMSELRCSHLPVTQGSAVVGLISLTDVADVIYEPQKGGKDAMVRRILPRRGLREGMQVVVDRHRTLASPTDAARRKSAPLFLRTGAAAAPRPNPKRGETLSEDAYFTAHVWWPGNWPSFSVDHTGAVIGVEDGKVAPGHTVTYIGIADGVGSWHERGVDPRLYATRLMEHAAAYVSAAAAAGRDPPSPLDVLTGAWEAVRAEKVVGSCTASIITLDSLQNQLCIAAIGDCGTILLRDTDIDRVGTLLRGGTPGGIRAGWRVSARSTQQLRGFNQPYQLGYAPGMEDRFQKPWEGEGLVLPVHPEDIIVTASDGLYDNLDETDILGIVEAWDKEDLQRRNSEAAFRREVPGTAAAAGAGAAVGSRAGSSAVSDGGAWEIGSSTSAFSESSIGRARLMDGSSRGAEGLATRLLTTARALSLDKMRDGPFARLAKENDIAWTQGGRPDDTTIIVARLSRKEATGVLQGESRTLVIDPAHQSLAPRNALESVRRRVADIAQFERSHSDTANNDTSNNNVASSNNNSSVGAEGSGQARSTA